MGIVQNYIAQVFWAVLLCNGFDLKASDNATTISQLTVMRFMNELTRWYKTPEGDDATQVSELSQKVFGKESKPACKTKAGETQGLMYFCVYRFRHKLRGKLGWKGVGLREAGEHIVGCVNLMRSCPRRPIIIELIIFNIIRNP